MKNIHPCYLPLGVALEYIGGCCQFTAAIILTGAFAMHNVYIVQYDSPVSKNWNPKTTFPWEKMIFEVIFPMFF